MPTIKGRVDRPDSITSETQWITMYAILDDPSPHDPAREYLLAININGIHHEFAAAEGWQVYRVTYSEAMQRIREFEQTMLSENRKYATDKFTTLLTQLDKIGK